MSTILCIPRAAAAAVRAKRLLVKLHDRIIHNVILLLLLSRCYLHDARRGVVAGFMRSIIVCMCCTGSTTMLIYYDADSKSVYTRHMIIVRSSNDFHSNIISQSVCKHTTIIYLLRFCAWNSWFCGLVFRTEKWLFFFFEKLTYLFSKMA